MHASVIQFCFIGFVARHGPVFTQVSNLSVVLLVGFIVWVWNELYFCLCSKATIIHSYD